MNGINKAIIMGHVGQDPKIQNFQNGGKAANFTIATTEKGYTTKNGTQIPDRTEWHNIVAFGSLAGVIERFVKKGTPVYVEGMIKTRNYTDQQNHKNYVTEIHVDKMELLPSGRENNAQNAQNTQNQQQFQSQGWTQ